MLLGSRVSRSGDDSRVSLDVTRVIVVDDVTDGAWDTGEGNLAAPLGTNDAVTRVEVSCARVEVEVTVVSVDTDELDVAGTRVIRGLGN